MKIYEAAAHVMRKSGRAMTTKEIYDAIIKDQLFKFEAKEPMGVVRQTLRKKSDIPANNGEVLFKRIGPNTFTLMG